MCHNERAIIDFTKDSKSGDNQYSVWAQKERIKIGRKNEEISCPDQQNEKGSPLSEEFVKNEEGGGGKRFLLTKAKKINLESGFPNVFQGTHCTYNWNPSNPLQTPPLAVLAQIDPSSRIPFH